MNISQCKLQNLNEIVGFTKKCINENFNLYIFRHSMVSNCNTKMMSKMPVFYFFEFQYLTSINK